MAAPILPLLLGVGVLAYVLTKKKKSEQSRSILSPDCEQYLLKPEDFAKNASILKWNTDFQKQNPLPAPPSDRSTMRGWVANYVFSAMEKFAPQCTYLFDEPLGTWPIGARMMFERAVYQLSSMLLAQGYDVVVPDRPPLQ